MNIDASHGPFSRLSLFSLRLDLVEKSEIIGTGTGFFYLSPEKSLYLVTNYHVVTSRDPQTDKPLSEVNKQPEEIRYRLLGKPDLQIVSGSVDLSSVIRIEHPRRSDGVDIIALLVKPPEEGYLLTQNNLDLVEDINIVVGGELYIIGYPFGIRTGEILPIWKRGTIASEPNYQPFGLDMFYIDATTKPGMSGSPVFASEIRQFYKVDKEISQAINKWEKSELDPLDVVRMMKNDEFNEVRRRAHKFVGIYSGGIIHGDNDPQIGIVWKRKLIDELFK